MTQPADDRVLVLGTANETLGILGAGRLRGPSAVAVAPTGDVYVGDDHGVSRYAAGGAKLGRWATDPPAGLAVAPDGSVVATGHGVVRRFAADGTLLGAYGADDPRGVGVAADGSIWVAVKDALAHLSAAGAPLGAYPAGDPRGVAVAADGSVLVAERHEDRVTRRTADGTRIGDVGGRIMFPEGVAADCRGNVAVSADDGRALLRLPTVVGSRPPCVGDEQTPVARRPGRRRAERRRLARAGVSAAVESVGRGRVLVRLPGDERTHALGAVRRLPMGTYVDARAGSVRLRFGARTGDFDRVGTSQRASFAGGAFTIDQGATRVNVRLAGPSAGCGGAPLRAEVRGRFRIVTHSAVVTVRRARLVVEDRCSGTRVSVLAGSARVRGLGGGPAERVRAGGRRVVP